MKLPSTPVLLLLALAAEAQQVRRSPKSNRRSLLCLGIFQTCDDDDDNDAGTNDGQVSGGTGVGGFLDDLNFPCLGIVQGRNCTTGVSAEDCETSGIFGGKPLFGDCGVVNEILDDAFNGTNSSSLDDLFSFSEDDEDGPLGLGLLAEGGLIWRIFNRDEDTSFLEAVFADFRNSTRSFSNGFLEDWSVSATATDTTCNATMGEPDCIDLTGGPGFWVCRTLTNPFSGEPGSKSICIGEGNFLEGNDDCGCCSGQNTTAPSCPAACGCACDLKGVGDGVWISSGSDIFDIELPIVCVTPEYAVSMTSRFDRISCLETCPE